MQLFFPGHHHCAFPDDDGGGQVVLRAALLVPEQPQPLRRHRGRRQVHQGYVHRPAGVTQPGTRCTHALRRTR